MRERSNIIHSRQRIVPGVPARARKSTRCGKGGKVGNPLQELCPGNPPHFPASLSGSAPPASLQTARARSVLMSETQGRFSVVSRGVTPRWSAAKACPEHRRKDLIAACHGHEILSFGFAQDRRCAQDDIGGEVTSDSARSEFALAEIAGNAEIPPA